MVVARAEVRSREADVAAGRAEHTQARREAGQQTGSHTGGLFTGP
jgi:hypothetical protein